MNRLKKTPITVSLESLVATTILTFCENLAELGCPQSADPDLWFRNLSEKEMDDVGGKLLDIQERDLKMAKKSKKTKKEIKPIIKTVIEDPLTGETFLQFTESELKQLGLKIGDVFDAKNLKDGSIVLEKINH